MPRHGSCGRRPWPWTRSMRRHTRSWGGPITGSGSITGVLTDPQTPKRAFELVRKALALDDTLPTAHSRLGQLYALQQQYDQAIAEAERAIALEPNNADSHYIHANVL